MQLVRDVLDKGVVDRNGRDIGRVDRLVIECGTGSPARVVALEIGPSALGARLSHLLGRWITGFLHGLGVEEDPLHVYVDQILSVTDAVKVDLAFGETPGASMERKLRRLLERIPGAHR